MKDLIFMVENHIVKITLNHASSIEMTDHWTKELESARDSDEFRVLVVSENGRDFCSGGNLKAMVNGQGLLQSDGKVNLSSTVLARKHSSWNRNQRIPLLLQEIDKPFIALLYGLVIGAGLDMALAAIFG